MESRQIQPLSSIGQVAWMTEDCACKCPSPKRFVPATPNGAPIPGSPCPTPGWSRGHFGPLTRRAGIRRETGGFPMRREGNSGLSMGSKVRGMSDPVRGPSPHGKKRAHEANGIKPRMRSVDWFLGPRRQTRAQREGAGHPAQRSLDHLDWDDIRRHVGANADLGRQILGCRNQRLGHW